MNRTSAASLVLVGVLAACGSDPAATSPTSNSSMAAPNPSNDPATSPLPSSNPSGLTPIPDGGAPATAGTGTTPPAVNVGGNVDAHGCHSGGGYRWCAKENACVRSWELAKKQGISNDKASIDGYCGT